jgi:ABC-type multidrug transport system fused ATPase/permease subunit
VCIISFILISFYTGLFKVTKTSQIINEFVNRLISLDGNVIDKAGAESLCEDFIKYTKANESRLIELYSRVLPFFVCFISIILFLFYIDKKTLFFVAYVLLILHVIIPFFMLIKHIFGVGKTEVFIKKFARMLLNSTRGIQFFGAKEIVFSRLNDDIKKMMQNEFSISLKELWRLFFSLCVIFTTLCFSYFITDLDYSKKVLQATNLYMIPCSSSIFLYIVFLRSFLKYKKLSGNNIPTAEVMQRYLLADDNCQYLTKFDSNKKLIIAFHGVSFNNRFAESDKPIFNDLTFSVLPSEMVSIIGENAYKYGSYIYDMILKFYTIQSGSIYISGTNINNLEAQVLRRKFYVLKEDFGLINGTVKDNILYTLHLNKFDKRKLSSVINKIGLASHIEDDIFNEFGDIAVSQKILIKMQMARALLIENADSNCYDAVLIEPPLYFSDPETEKLFYEMVNISFQKKIIMIITDKPSLIIKSHKILYLGHDKSLFGAHADLVNDKSYQTFITNKIAYPKL